MNRVRALQDGTAHEARHGMDVILRPRAAANSSGLRHRVDGEGMALRPAGQDVDAKAGEKLPDVVVLLDGRSVVGKDESIGDEADEAHRCPAGAEEVVGWIGVATPCGLPPDLEFP